MGKPIIGISIGGLIVPEGSATAGRFSLDREYIEHVDKAGGVPVLIPPGVDGAAIMPELDGWLIPGGGDFDASLWSEATHKDANLEPSGRTDTEFLMWEALPEGMPIFGICYGCQFMNVAMGGDLEQHLPDRLGHNEHSGGTLQAYSIDEKSAMGGLIGASIDGKSYHHQAIGKVADGLKVVGWHGEGDEAVIEAVEGVGERWIWGVQWHPERSETGKSQLLFDEFVEKCRGFRREKAGEIGAISR